MNRDALDRPIKIVPALGVALAVALASYFLNARIRKNEKGNIRQPSGGVDVPSFAPQGGAKWSGGHSDPYGRGYWTDDRGWNYQNAPTREQMNQGGWRYVPPRR